MVDERKLYFVILVQMATLNNEDILRLAQLAKLRLEDSEVESFKQEINEILGYIETLQTIDVSDETPTIQVTGLSNVTRPDVVMAYQASPKDLLDTVAGVSENQIRVNRVIN